MSNCAAQIYVSTTAKGTATSFSGNTVSVRNISAINSGISISDIQNLRIRVVGTRGSYGSSYIRTHGSDITVDYSWPVYYYTVTASATNNYGTVSPTSQEYEEGQDSTITMTPVVAGFAPTKVLDNNVDVTSSIVAHDSGAYYTYDISGIAADHTVVVTFSPPVTHTVSGTVDSSLSISPSLPQTIGEGTELNIYITPSKPGTITVVDNNVVAHTYTIPVDDLSAVVYVVQDIQTDHVLNIQFIELEKYTISGTIVSGLSISPSLPQTRYATDDIDFTITPTAAGLIIIDDNGIEYTYPIPRDDIHSITYSLTALAASHVLTITFEPLQQYQISGTVVSGLTISPSLPQYVYTGDDISFTITPSAGGTIIVNDNDVDYIYTVSRTDIQPVVHTITAVSDAHVLAITYEPPQQYTISGTVASGLSISPAFPQSVYTGDDITFTITPTNAGIIRVIDNEAETGVYEIPLDDISSVLYRIEGISTAHVLNIVFEALPQYTISAVETDPQLTITPSLPVTKYLGQSQSLTIMPATSGQITVIDNGQEKAVYYIVPGDVHAVTYSITNIATDHELEFKFSALPQFTATATLTGTGTLSTNSITDYAGYTVTFTVTGVPASNILIIKNNNRNVSSQATKSGTTYTYAFVLINDCTIEFISKVPGQVAVDAYIDQDGTISPASTTVTEGDEYTLAITPNDYQSTATKPLSVSDNYVEVVDTLVARKDTASSTFTATSSTTSSISSNANLFANAVGKTAESPSTTSTTSNAYASRNNTGYAEYSFNFSGIPSDATILSVSCSAYGHAENATYTAGSRECTIQLYNNTTAVGTAVHYASTSNSILTIQDCGT